MVVGAVDRGERGQAGDAADVDRCEPGGVVGDDADGLPGGELERGGAAVDRLGRIRIDVDDARAGVAGPEIKAIADRHVPGRGQVENEGPGALDQLAPVGADDEVGRRLGDDLRRAQHRLAEEYAVQIRHPAGAALLERVDPSRVVVVPLLQNICAGVHPPLVGVRRPRGGAAGVQARERLERAFDVVSDNGPRAVRNVEIILAHFKRPSPSRDQLRPSTVFFQ